MQRKPKHAAVVKPSPALKRPLREDPAWRKALKAVGLNSETNQAVAIFLAGLLLIVLLFWAAGSTSSARRPRVTA